MYNLAQPHAVSAVVGGGLPSHTFAYDANGNLDTLDGTPMISWSSYDKPVAITTASVSYGFDYGPDRARYRKVHNGQTTHYVGKNFEAINASGVGFDTHRHYVRANGRVVMIREDVNGAVTHRYVHTDHLGSITALTDEATGTVVARYSYDAWGLRRNPTTWQPGPVASFERRGYTGHEHLDHVGIIHMNGRLYSPSLGRMLSPDPLTFAPEDAQGYNRYSYVLNNPLRYTDPSGFSPSNDAQIQKVDPVKLPGPMSHVSVTASRVSSTASFFSGFTSSSLVLGSSGSTFPSSEPGDNMTDTGNPVAEVERDDTQSTRVCGENNLECTAPTTAENLQNTLANYQRFLQQVQMDQLFWEDLARRSGNAAVGFAGAGVFFSQVGVIGAGATVFAVVSIGALHFADEADKANVASAYLTTQQLIKVALNGVPILRNNPAAMNRVTQVFSYISGMTTIDIESN